MARKTLHVIFEGSDAEIEELVESLAEARRTGDERLSGNWLCSALDPATSSRLMVKAEHMEEWKYL